MFFLRMILIATIMVVAAGYTLADEVPAPACTTIDVLKVSNPPGSNFVYMDDSQVAELKKVVPAIPPEVEKVVVGQLPAEMDVHEAFIWGISKDGCVMGSGHLTPETLAEILTHAAGTRN
jgi:hypothetical protein